MVQHAQDTTSSVLAGGAHVDPRFTTLWVVRHTGSGDLLSGKGDLYSVDDVHFG